MILRSLVFFVALACTAAVDPALLQVKTIYLMPMSGGLDQYLANRISKAGQYRVVTDPALADAIFTDRLGPAFESAFAELYPPPKPVEEPTESKKETSVAEGMAEATGDAKPRVSAFSKGRGNVFLVDRKTRQVIWSDFRRVKRARPTDIDDIAEDMSNQLHKDIKPAN